MMLQDIILTAHHDYSIDADNDSIECADVIDADYIAEAILDTPVVGIISEDYEPDTDTWAEVL